MSAILAPPACSSGGDACFPRKRPRFGRRLAWAGLQSCGGAPRLRQFAACRASISIRGGFNLNSLHVAIVRPLSVHPPPHPSPQVGVVGFWVLNFMWLKFTAIWRFFRLWALLLGVSPPENMLRCVNNNYDIEGFWKVWAAVPARVPCPRRGAKKPR